MQCVLCPWFWTMTCRVRASIWLAVLTSACGDAGSAEHQIAALTVGADPSDPYGSCELTNSRGLPFACSVSGVPCAGWGGASLGLCADADCETEAFRVVCDHSCAMDIDCPVPSSGNAVPVCISGLHACELPCDESTTCPDGYACESTASWGVEHNGVPATLPFICMQTLSASFSH